MDSEQVTANGVLGVRGMVLVALLWCMMVLGNAACDGWFYRLFGA